jgi:glycosyltransferase involved in cell wall biosynthesis
MAVLDTIASIVNRGVSIDIPTGVGFCMYIRQGCLKDVGYFDVATFNRGYGEENDFCMRATKEGWRHVAAADVLVRHTGEVSFALDASTQQKSGYQSLIRKHPAYESIIQQFANRDRLREARIKIDLGRLRVHTKANRTLLFISHGFGGGIETHMRDLARLLEPEGYTVLLLRTSRTDRNKFCLNLLDSPLFLPNLESLTLDDFVEYVIPVLASWRLQAVHVHSLAGFSLSRAKAFLRAFSECQIKLLLTIHDYSPVCPRNQLIDDGMDYCFLPPTSVCRECTRNLNFSDSELDIHSYRRTYEDLLPLFSSIYVPSDDTRLRLSREFPSHYIMTIPHPELPSSDELYERFFPRKRATGKQVKVAIVGAIGPHKGSQILLACARDVIARRLPILFKVIGYTDIDDKLRNNGVEITGKYHSEMEMADQLYDFNPDIIFLPSIWPETYLYTLSIALRSGTFPVAFDIGAQAERIQRSEHGALLDIHERHNPEFINAALLKLSTLARAEPRKRTQFGTAEDIASLYGYSSGTNATRRRTAVAV